jgi:phosphatidylethanolamine/phosphatidyl-N-methylethanolamine N-methyltransferase
MRTADVLEAYARWAPIYDVVFGPVLSSSRKAAIAALPRFARRVLEVGVGTGISLPEYPPRTRVVGIDLSARMLQRARARAARADLANVEALLEMDAARLDFAGNSFDVAMAMYVMTVVPDPERAMAEMHRVVKPGGRVLAVSHFASEAPIRRQLSIALAPVARAMGWSTTVTSARLAAIPGFRLLSDRAVGLCRFYRLLEFEVVK